MIESAVCWLLGERPCRSGASVHCSVVTCETQVWQLLGRRVTAQLIMSTSLVVEPPIISTLSEPIKNNFAVVSVSGTESRSALSAQSGRGSNQSRRLRSPGQSRFCLVPTGTVIGLSIKKMSKFIIVGYPQKCILEWFKT